MNDRAVGILDRYDVEVLRTRKGRGAILCETKQGLKIIKEYKGTREKAALQHALLTHIQQSGQVDAEMILSNREGELLTVDTDQTVYMVKDYFDGRECNMKEPEEGRRVMVILAKLHRDMAVADPYIASSKTEETRNFPVYQIEQEFDKHNRELRKIRKYIRAKGQKTDFEIYLLKHYDIFMEKALSITQQVKAHDFTDYYETIRQKGTFCHGDYQYHNILFGSRQAAVINFEKCILDSNVRDISLFMRKLLEKNNWAQDIGYDLLNTYEKEKPLEPEDRMQLYYRLAYPEKFWKIVNFYYNSSKVWIPGRNMDKLNALLVQESAREEFLRSILE